MTLRVTADSPLTLALAVTASPPAGADGPAATVDLEPNQQTAAATVDLSWPVAGAFRFGHPTVVARDPAGLFEQRLETGSRPTVAVEPRGPRNVHVGEGGEAIAAGFGEHEAGRLGSGLEPAEVRKYVPGDTIRRMDWKATARLDEPHVREFEAETDRETVLVLDHRASSAVGPPGETALEYLRQVALAFVDSARELADPLGAITVDDEGVTATFEPNAGAAHLRGVRRRLQAVEAGEEAPERTATPGRVRHGPRDPGEVRRDAARLTDDAPFARTLRPFLDRPEAYVERVADDPLFAGVRSATSQFAGRLWTVLFTTDAHRTEVREAVTLARRGDGNVLVFLAPTALYDQEGLADLEAAYGRYQDFERFRRELAAMERVRAFEVGPADRLSRVLESGRTSRERRRRG